ncbi:unnamed protein product [Fraxinus pennsylvanica]|uniref:Uncharacterized protein n=1 Tax=Fraxinus pennsylvanica TaxID=56036 RepID=A0AAD2DTX2_9LAMI|nr:unnamed protein product [Fraxinus pennsylvanica]
MPSQVRWSSMPRVPRLQDEEGNDLTETGSESIDISLSSEDNDGLDGRRRGPNYGTNGRADEYGRTPLTVGGNRYLCEFFFLYVLYSMQNGVTRKWNANGCCSR